MHRPARVAVVGRGRVGLVLARALACSGLGVRVLARSRSRLPAPLGHSLTGWRTPLGEADLILIAVTDDEIAGVAEQIEEMGVVRRGQVVLHTSGLLDSGALGALKPAGASLGSFHPLQSFVKGSWKDDDILTGITMVAEGDRGAVAAGRRLARVLGMRPVTIAARDKPRYHAAAVFASNYLVVLGDIAARLGKFEGGVEPFLPLMRTTLANLEAVDLADALTGPISRGDVGTVRAHLAVLTGTERELYLMLGREALRIAAPKLARKRVAELREVLGAP
ncbi:MAG TPA: DUF2520 domain-containing protein [Gemmatimonadales bacterium]|nr:DUF2520 domain-containing protein [Gemmatimonadales bacterium]